MVTKKQKRRGNVRRTRRILNRALDFCRGASLKAFNVRHYGGGLRRSDIREWKEV